ALETPVPPRSGWRRPCSAREPSTASCCAWAAQRGCGACSPRRSRTSPSASPLAQLALEDLARGVAGKLVHELDLARHLVAREVGPNVLLRLVLGQLRVVPCDDERLQALAELLVVDADHRDLLDGVVL